jgi:hypothetical protein
MTTTLQTVNQLITTLNYGELEVLFSILLKRQRELKAQIEATLNSEVA